ncbi:MAG: hypothetical protein R2939_21710 [Kofleriaceae bacterium]
MSAPRPRPSTARSTTARATLVVGAALAMLGASCDPDDIPAIGPARPDASPGADAGAPTLAEVLADLDYEPLGELRPMLGASLRLEGLAARDAAGQPAWASDEVRALGLTDLRFPPGSQSYLMLETDGDAELQAALTALGATSSRTHAPQFTDAHLGRAGVAASAPATSRRSTSTSSSPSAAMYRGRTR